MLIGFKTRLEINNRQKTLLAKHAGVARDAFNWGLGLTKEILSHNQENPTTKIKFPTAIDLHKWLVGVRKVEKPFYYEVSKCAPQYALRQLREAWDRCFKKISGVPKFKKKGKQDSFTLDGSIRVISSNKIKVPVIGVLKTHEQLPQVDKIKSITISKQAEQWFISFKIEVIGTPTFKVAECPPACELPLKGSSVRGGACDDCTSAVKEISTPKNHNVVGCDLGIKSLAILSTGEVFEGTKSYRKAEKKLAQLQREVSRKVKGSKNRAKAISKLRLAHLKVANIRKDTLHKLTSHLSKNHAVIGIEDLNVSGMLANHKLAKSIADMGFYEFRRQLEYKCKLYGSQLVLVDRWFPSSKTCSKCGCVKKSLSLSERTFICENKDCNLIIDRDLNAAINLEKYAASSVVKILVDEVLPTVSVEAGIKQTIQIIPDYTDCCKS